MKTKYSIDVSNNLSQLKNMLPTDVGAALYIEAEKVMTNSQQNFVPVVTGDLRRSGFVEEPTYASGKIEVVCGFGSNTTAYAAAVHEAPPNWGQGRRKYLTIPLQLAIPQMAKSIAVTVGNRLFSRSNQIIGGARPTRWEWSS